jgi:hypothetical protein
VVVTTADRDGPSYDGRVDFETYDRLLNEAMGKPGDPMPVGDGRRWMVPSSTDPNAAYTTGAGFCNCPAGERGRLCWHRARVLFDTGLDRVYVPRYADGRPVDWDRMRPLQESLDIAPR